MSDQDALIRSLRNVLAHWQRSASESARDPDDPKSWERDGYLSGVAAIQQFASDVAAVLDRPAPPQNCSQFACMLREGHEGPHEADRWRPAPVEQG